MEKTKIVGVDIGGTKVFAGLVENGEVIKKHQFALTTQASAETVIKQIIDTISEVIDSEVKGIGVGVPGFVDDINGVVYEVANIPSWNKMPIKKHLEKAFNIPVYLNNDANSFAIGERIFGKGQKYNNFVGIILGIGLGAGVISNGKLITGVNCGAGELAFAPYLESYYEKYCSGQFFKNVHNTNGKELFDRAEKGDKDALKIFSDFGIHLGEYIKILLLAYAPEAVIFGGSINASFPYFIESLKKTVATFPFDKVKENFQAEVSNMKDTAVLGTAALFYNAN